jgi:hypothetical protein
MSTSTSAPANQSATRPTPGAMPKKRVLTVKPLSPEAQAAAASASK